ncbi:hypothetical protein M5K25_006156 [Dendrobium thyrsiflorum]|uniref:Fatty acid amide hydrolase n=1 Tax=Dendrobium thyrsiflorum TaxID=117978 RepID=A0ABD0VB14_DENTH
MTAAPSPFSRYAALAGSSLNDRISLRPSPICLPDLSTPNSSYILRSVKLGKYSEWFNDVYSTDISAKCNDALNQLSELFGCSIIEIVLPEQHVMQPAHVVSIGSESLCALNPDCEDGRNTELSLDTRVSLALFRSFSAADYVAAQRLRRRIMYYYMEAFKKVDIIVTPTTGYNLPFLACNLFPLQHFNIYELISMFSMDESLPSMDESVPSMVENFSTNRDLICSILTYNSSTLFVAIGPKKVL